MKNTDKTFIIEVENRQTIDGETSSVSERAEGSYYTRGGKRYIIYRSVTDGAEYSTIIIAEDERVSVKRSGFTQSNIKCDRKLKTKSYFITPYGKFAMDIKTEAVISDLDESGGILKLKYISTMQEQKYINNMTIRINEVTKL